MVASPLAAMGLTLGVAPLTVASPPWPPWDHMVASPPLAAMGLTPGVALLMVASPPWPQWGHMVGPHGGAAMRHMVARPP